MNVCYPRAAQEVFTRKNVNYMILLSWSVGLAFFCGYMHPAINFLYDPSSFSFIYQANYSTYIVMVAHLLISFGNMACIVLWFVLTFVLVKNVVRFEHTCDRENFCVGGGGGVKSKIFERLLKIFEENWGKVFKNFACSYPFAA